MTHDPGLYPRQILIKLSTQVGSLISNGFASPPGSSNLAAIGNSINTIQYARQDVKTSVSHHSGCPSLPGSPPQHPSDSSSWGSQIPPGSLDPLLSIPHKALQTIPAFTLLPQPMSAICFTQPSFGAFRPFSNALPATDPISIPLLRPPPFPLFISEA